MSLRKALRTIAIITLILACFMMIQIGAFATTTGPAKWCDDGSTPKLVTATAGQAVTVIANVGNLINSPGISYTYQWYVKKLAADGTPGPDLVSSSGLQGVTGDSGTISGSTTATLTFGFDVPIDDNNIDYYRVELKITPTSTIQGSDLTGCVASICAEGITANPPQCSLTDQTICKSATASSTYDYPQQDGYTVTWTLTPVGSTTPVFTSNGNAVNGNNEVTITWASIDIGTYTLTATVTPKTTSGQSGTTCSATIQLIDKPTAQIS